MIYAGLGNKSDGNGINYVHGKVRKVGDRGAATLKIQGCLNFPDILIEGCLGDAIIELRSIVRPM